MQLDLSIFLKDALPSSVLTKPELLLNLFRIEEASSLLLLQNLRSLLESRLNVFIKKSIRVRGDQRVPPTCSECGHPLLHMLIMCNVPL